LLDLRLSARYFRWSGDGTHAAGRYCRRISRSDATRRPSICRLLTCRVPLGAAGCPRMLRHAGRGRRRAATLPPGRRSARTSNSETVAFDGDTAVIRKAEGRVFGPRWANVAGRSDLRRLEWRRFQESWDPGGQSTLCPAVRPQSKIATESVCSRRGPTSINRSPMGDSA